MTTISDTITVVHPGPTPPEPTPLDAREPAALDVQLIAGDWLGDMACAVSSSTQTPLELSVGMGWAVAAASIANTYQVQVAADHHEPLSLWTMSPLPSGSRKSAVTAMHRQPVDDWVNEQSSAMSAQILRAQSERKTIEARIASLRSSAAKAEGAEHEQLREQIADMEANLPAVPTLPVIYTTDVTPERIASLAAESGLERMAVISDEGGIFDTMAGRYSNGVPNYDVYLQGHAGNAVHIDRGSRPPVRLRRPAISMGILPQPDVLRCLRQHKGAIERGLCARFLYFMPRSLLGFRTLDVDPVPAEVSEAYQQGIFALLNKKPFRDDAGFHPYTIHLSTEARQAWAAFWYQVEGEMRTGGRFEHMTDWAGKLPGAVARLAGILHCVAHAHDMPDQYQIDTATMDRAVALGHVLIEHAICAYDLMGAAPEVIIARRALAWMTRDGRAEFTRSECWQALKGGLNKAIELDPALDLLVDTGHIWAVRHEQQGAGRPAQRYAVHPSVLTKGRVT